MNSQINTYNLSELVKKRDECLPSIINSFEDDLNTKNLLDHVNLMYSFLPTYEVDDVNQELLSYLAPAIRNCIDKCFEDNVLIVTTTDDNIMLDMLKENILIVSDLLQVFIKTLNYFIEKDNVFLNHITFIPGNISLSLQSTFKHCRESQGLYRNNLNSELLDLFKTAQELHLLILKFFEEIVVIDEFSECLNVLTDFLDAICDIGEILSEINVKSMVDNWKGYTAITKKFVNFLQTFNLTKPINYLNNEIQKNLKLFNADSDSKTLMHTIKVASFLEKVVLKLCETFWDYLDTDVFDRILNFFVIIYSNSRKEVFYNQKYPADILQLFENTVIKIIDSLLDQLCSKISFVKFLENVEVDTDSQYGLLCVFSKVFKSISLKEEVLNSNQLLKNMFVCFSNCYKELTLISQLVDDNLYEDLIVNTSAFILLKCFEVEEILLENLLCDNLWASLFVVDVWCLILNNSSPQTALNTLNKLIEFTNSLNFGTFSRTPQSIFLNNLIRRIYGILPIQLKNEFALKHSITKPNVYLWKALGFQNINLQNRYSIEGIFFNCQQDLSLILNGNLDNSELINTIDILITIASLNYKELGLDYQKFVTLIANLWEFNLNDETVLRNNIFKYFISTLCSITKTLIREFNVTQLTIILNQLKALASEDSYKLIICNAVISLNNCDTNNFGNDQYKIFRLLSGIFYPILMKNANVVQKQITLDAIKEFGPNLAYDNLIKNVLQNAKEFQGEILSRLQENVNLNIDKEYIKFEMHPYQHKCITWNRNKRNKPTVVENKTDSNVRVSKIRYKENLDTHPPVKRFKSDEPETEDVTEVLDRLQDEVKCLTKVLKTEKMSVKNVSKLRIIISQLQNLS